ncbi:transposase [Bacillus sp. AP8]|uniref:transposase n=1 Tax=Bacillus sp. AP8 TaxID=1513284 RepID=UPI000B44B07C|nr:transposase [Bacillus sp. AP8]
MKILLILSTFTVPIIMFFLQKLWKKTRILFNYLAFLSIIIFGSITSVSVYQIIKDQTVFMTNIHAILLNPFFLLTGAYLGLYITYQLINLSLNER